MRWAAFAGGKAPESANDIAGPGLDQRTAVHTPGNVSVPMDRQRNIRAGPAVVRNQEIIGNEDFGPRMRVLRSPRNAPARRLPFDPHVPVGPQAQYRPRRAAQADGQVSNQE